ncbi:ABC transporter permease [Devosia sp. FJ2-5-3]|jgi:sulfonate transport system permease protein|uniref:ABC transporter permease n=1 Tax=Devosia sp. FJ2-5-3 TaxID=2976680 RepID=UPI0023D86F62|nr:ABC transporter permease [Devosia sp. FJ2-5-3]WEJ58090.1 ABC transporter permease [Devosia sp. FJ2-5-3]
MAYLASNERGRPVFLERSHYSGEGRALPANPRRKRRLGPGKEIPFGLQIGPALMLLAWVAGSGLGLVDPRILPAPWTIVATFGELIADGRLQSNFATSAVRALLGLGFGIVIGLVLAIASGLSRIGEALIDGPIQIKRAVPTLAMIPLLILWLGLGETMKVTIITLGVIVPIYMHTHNALRAIDERYVELAETLRMSQRDFLFQVVLPGAVPGFLLGLRFAVTLCWVSLVVVEQINATSGLGYMIDLARTYGQTRIIIVGLVVYALLGLTSDAIVRLLERKLLSWRRTLSH